MYYSEDLIEEVRSRNDIVDVISGYVRLQRRGSSYFGLCPFHNEKSPSFSVSPGKQMYYCFGCGAGGNVFTFLMEYENYTFPEAVKTLAPGLVEIARSTDDLIEAVYLPGKTFVWAVQWHPEMSLRADEASGKIFKAFVEATNRRMN